MANNEKSAILSALIKNVLYDLMVKTNVYNVMVDDTTTLAAKLSEVITSLNNKVTPEKLKEALDAIGEGPQGPQGPAGETGPQGPHGVSGVWVGSEAPTDSGYNVWVDPNGRSTSEFPGSGGNVDVTIDGETLVIA